MISEEQKNKVIELMKECIKETGVDVEILKKAQIGQYTDDDKLKKQLFCFNKKLGMQNEAGDIMVDVTEKRLANVIKDPAVRKEAVTKCLVKSGTPEETAYNSTKCLHPYLPHSDVLN